MSGRRRPLYSIPGKGRPLSSSAGRRRPLRSVRGRRKQPASPRPCTRHTSWDTAPRSDARSLRDFHSAATIEIDVAVIDFLVAVMDAVDAQSASIPSAYRTLETNAILERTTHQRCNAEASAGTPIPGSPYRHRTGAQPGPRRERARLLLFDGQRLRFQRQRAIGNQSA
jgi:hypothetical protein